MKFTADTVQKQNENNKTKIFRKDKVTEPKDPMALSAKIYADSEPAVNEAAGWFRLLPAAVFLVFLFGLSVWFIVNPKLDYSPTEKRYLQKFPEPSFENIVSGKFGAEFESYYADHFPARNMWVGFNSYYNLSLGNNGANGVYKGKDGYLINRPVSSENNIQKNLSAVIDFKENLGKTPVTVLLAPSTGYIASDKLPLVHDPYRDDVYFNNARKTLVENGIAFVDVRDSFRDAYAQGTQLYYRTDHHWTTPGAYVAYTELCAALGKRPVDKDSLSVGVFPGFYGTTYSTSGFWLTAPDTIETWSNTANGNNIRVTITEGTETTNGHSLYFYNHLDEDDKYPVFLDGNHALTTIENTNVPDGTLVVVKDSFSHCLAPFLAENYRKVILVDMRYYKLSVSDLVKSEKADRVAVLYGIDNFATDTDLVWIN